MKIDDKLEIKVVVATLDNNDNIIDIYYDWRDVMVDIERHRFGFRIIETLSGNKPSDFADFYETISDAMNDHKRISLIWDLIAQFKKGSSIFELAEMFNLSENRVNKILDEYTS